MGSKTEDYIMAKKNQVFAWSPVRRLMKSCGAQIVSRDAVNILIDHLEEKAERVTKKALTFTGHANRKKITKEDIDLALKYI